MADVVAELLSQVGDLEAEVRDIQRTLFVRDLRRHADRYPNVQVTLTAEVARLLAYELEEYSMLVMVPPTGDDG